MDNVRETAIYLTIWYAFLTVLGATLLIVLNDLDPATALLAAANIALLFALALMARAGRLTEHRMPRGQFWRALPRTTRPSGEAGLRMARTVLEETWLRFARGAAAVAIVLSGLAYLTHDAGTAAWAQAVHAPGAVHAASSDTAWIGYRPLQPMN